MNKFTYEPIYSMGNYVFKWVVEFDGLELTGTSGSLNRAYKDAKKRIKLQRKMQKFLDRKD